MTNIPIFLSSDNNYAPFVATTMASICDNTKSFIDFYILDGGISKENQAKICELKNKFDNFSIEFINIKQDDLSSIVYKNDCKYVTLSTYNRFLIPRLKPEIKKAIYLDVDIIVKGDITSFYEIDLKDYVIAAVSDFGCSKDYLDNVKKNIGLQKNSIYFNAGVLLINCEKWHQQDIEQKLFQIEERKRTALCMADQDVLNICFENNYKILDEKFNVVRPNPNIVIRHFAGQIKPWQADFYLDPVSKAPKRIQNVELFWKYAAMTPFYEEIKQIKEDFLNSNVLCKRFNKIVNQGEKL